MNFASYLILVILALKFLGHLYNDVNGRPSRPPEGFLGVLSTIIVYSFLVWLYYMAGLFGK